MRLWGGLPYPRPSNDREVQENWLAVQGAHFRTQSVPDHKGRQVHVELNSDEGVLYYIKNGVLTPVGMGGVSTVATQAVQGGSSTSSAGGGGSSLRAVAVALVANTATYALGFSPGTSVRLAWTPGGALAHAVDFTIADADLTLLGGWVPTVSEGYLIFLGSAA
jgi:hypothetical protein